ncbi:MCE family protein [Nocardioides alcanivorans]|uniref:MCE family protein n=1 Tax=Nocardioides alcanivorans TaxID=2897352 RepID=UPI001F374CDD|nr:MCE family protein [Nocardioides alcanivorans]
MARRRARRWQVSAVVLTLFATMFLAACDLYDLPLPGSPVDKDHAYQVTADFEDVMNVVPKSPVMVDDVTVGEVLEVERDGWRAKVTMHLRDDVVLPANAVAEIRQTSLLGEKYVALETPLDGGRGQLADGAHIDQKATSRNPEVEEVLDALSFLLSGGGVAQLGNITHELNELMSGREGDLKKVFNTLDDVIGTLDDQKVDIINALESMNRLSTTLNSERDTISDALDAMAPAVGVLRDQQRNLVTMLTELENLGKVGTRVIGASKDDLLAVLGDLKPILTRLNEAGETLPEGLSLMLSFPFPDEAREIVKGDYANAQIKLDVSLDNFIGSEPLINPGETLDKVGKCVASLNVLGAQCQAVLADLDLVKKLKQVCNGPGLANNPVCLLVKTLPDLSGLLGLASHRAGKTDGTTTETGLLGVGGLARELTSTAPEDPSPDLYGKALS